MYLAVDYPELLLMCPNSILRGLRIKRNKWLFRPGCTVPSLLSPPKHITRAERLKCDPPSYHDGLYSWYTPSNYLMGFRYRFSSVKTSFTLLLSRNHFQGKWLFSNLSQNPMDRSEQFHLFSSSFDLIA